MMNVIRPSKGALLAGAMIIGLGLGASTAEARPNRLIVGKQARQAVLKVTLRVGSSKVRQIKKARFRMALSCRKDGYRPMGINNRGFGRIRASHPATKKGTWGAALTQKNKHKANARKWCRRYWKLNSKRRRGRRVRNTCREAFAVYAAKGVCIKVKGTFFGKLIEKKYAKFRGKVRYCCDFRRLPVKK